MKNGQDTACGIDHQRPHRTVGKWKTFAHNMRPFKANIREAPRGWTRYGSFAVMVNEGRKLKSVGVILCLRFCRKPKSLPAWGGQVLDPVVSIFNVTCDAADSKRNLIGGSNMCQ